MSRWNWPRSVRSWFELDCNRCGFLTAVLTRAEAFAVAIAEHSQCRPTVVTVVRRGYTPAKKKWRCAIWMHNGP
jgi:hypothetical protein